MTIYQVCDFHPMLPIQPHTVIHEFHISNNITQFVTYGFWFWADTNSSCGFVSRRALSSNVISCAEILARNAEREREREKATKQSQIETEPHAPHIIHGALSPFRTNWLDKNERKIAFAIRDMLCVLFAIFFLYFSRLYGRFGVVCMIVSFDEDFMRAISMYVNVNRMWMNKK